jgi:hypothetical protein
MHMKSAHYTVKGMSAEVINAKPFLGNMRVTGKCLSDAEEGENAEGTD